MDLRWYKRDVEGDVPYDVDGSPIFCVGAGAYDSPYGVDFVVCSGDYSRKSVFLKGEELK